LSTLIDIESSVQSKTSVMRREPTFNKGGSYQFIIGKNLGLHREAIATSIEIVSKFLSSLPKTKKTLNVLDLACGASPVIIAEVMNHFSNYSFEYTGIDINPDQVATCRKFSFPKNVIKKEVIEENAWNLEEHSLKDKVDLVFIGLNTHHGTPEEISFLAKQIFSQLNKGGVFLNHDLFRPEKYPYLRRPKKGLPKNDWRDEWLSGYKSFLKTQGQSEDLAEQGIDHMRNWDYPISMEEMRTILVKIGFRVSTHSYTNPNHPFSNFYGMVVGYKV